MAAEKQLVSYDDLELLHQSTPAVTVIRAGAPSLCYYYYTIYYLLNAVPWI